MTDLAKAAAEYAGTGFARYLSDQPSIFGAIEKAKYDGFLAGDAHRGMDER